MDKLDGIKAIFWDWDGTLVDSFSFLHKTHNHVRGQFGMPSFTIEEFGNYFGKPREKLYRDIYGAQNIEKAKKHFEAFVLANHHEIQPMDGAERLLQAFADLELPMAVVTNKKGPLVAKEINNHGWDNHFIVTVGAGEAEEDKPSPAPLYLALEKSGLDIEPHEVLFVGDTENDVLCAHHAGAKIAFIEEDLEKQAIAQEHNALLMFRNCDEFADFVLQDKSGSMSIDPFEATIEAIKVHSRFTPSKHYKSAKSLKVGESRILGHQYNEWILPLNRETYILGEVRHKVTGLQMGRPSDSKKQFLISHRSETQLLKERKKFAAVNRNWALILVAIAMAIAVKLHFDKQPLHHLVRVMEKTEISQVIDLKRMDVPPTDQNLYVEVAGTAKVAKAFQPKFVDQPSIYVRTLQTGDYKERYTDSEGRRKTRRVTEIISDNIRAIAFQIEDGTGSITVQPQGAEYDALKVWDKYEPDEWAPEKSATKELLGYHYKEWIIPADEPAYVVGTLAATGNGVAIQNPVGDEVERSAFFISHRSPAEALQYKQRMLAWRNLRIVILVGTATALLCIMVKEIIV